MLLFNFIEYNHIYITKKDFNTSNVTIQPCCCFTNEPNLCISIHLMLLFNAHVFPERLYFLDFNTSNVTIQLYPPLMNWLSTAISIHLMLLFNVGIYCASNVDTCISIHLMLLFNFFYISISPNFFKFQYI